MHHEGHELVEPIHTSTDQLERFYGELVHELRMKGYDQVQSIKLSELALEVLRRS